MTIFHSRTVAMAALMVGVAGHAAAQGMCGGAGDGGQWIGGDPAGSDIALVDNYQEQMALVLGGNEYVSLFSLSEGAEVRIEAEGRGAGDPVMDLLDASGGIVLSDDDSGGNAAARAETFLDAGDYCMSLRSYDGGPMTAFVRIGRVEHDPLTLGLNTDTDNGGEAVGDCALATPLGPLGSSGVGSLADHPYWSFTLDAPAPVTITAENEDADPVVTLYGPGDEYIAENDDHIGLNSRLDVAEPLAAGTYCIAMDALSDDTAPMTVSVTEYDPEAALAALFDTGEASPPLDGSHPVTDLGALQDRIREDVQATETVTWFSVTVDDPGLLVAEAIGATDIDPWLTVYDDLGRLIGQNDDHAEGLDSFVAARVDRGTYIVGVSHYGSNTGLVRLLLERWVQPQ